MLTRSSVETRTRKYHSLKGAVGTPLRQNEAELKISKEIDTSASFWQSVTTTAPFNNWDKRSNTAGGKQEAARQDRFHWIWRRAVYSPSQIITALRESWVIWVNCGAVYLIAQYFLWCLFCVNCIKVENKIGSDGAPRGLKVEGVDF